MKYTNISNHRQVVVGIGSVEAGATIETKDILISNPNFRIADIPSSSPAIVDVSHDTIEQSNNTQE